MHGGEMGVIFEALPGELMTIGGGAVGAMLIGNNVVNIGASAFTTSVLIQFFGVEVVVGIVVAHDIYKE
jgi:Mg2+/Co2+ transporter CorB